MDVIVRRCPFLARMPQAFVQQSKKTLVTYAQRCPIMMELAAKPMAPSMARALCSSSSSYQKPENTVSAGEGDKDGGHTGYSNQHYSCVIFSQINHVIIELLINVKFTFFPFAAPKKEVESKLPAGHPMPPPGQMKASKCPFLAAEMSQKNSGVVRQIGIEFQEDVQEVRTVKKGEFFLLLFFFFFFFEN